MTIFGQWISGLVFGFEVYFLDEEMDVGDSFAIVMSFGIFSITFIKHE